MTRRYAALIRTFNSADTLPDTLRLLSAQTLPPHQYIFVDSGSTDGTLAILPPGSTFHTYIGEHFNFAAALNQGLEYVSTEYVLIISAHTLLRDPGAIAYALALLASNERIGAAYFCDENTGTLRHTLIDKTSFDGFNGLWNTCSLIKLDLLKRRRFRPEVFIAEDQEWARWLLFCEDKVVARIAGAGMDNTRNPNAIKHGWRKSLNEYVAIAYFAHRKLLGPRNLARIAYQAVSPTGHSSLRERRFYLGLLFNLAACYIRTPKYRSKYF